ncbi:MAG TPA: hypothetical protein DEB09_04130 [Candidatus Magasanikbacteria bacterium]|nr:hypothetical protein [Candidatus Magasanikbacteria bacterium]
MSKIAIDIVLLPPDDIMDICIDINPKLNHLDRLPHISILMGVLDDTNIEDVEQTISKIDFKKLELEISKLVFFQRPDNTTNCYFKIKRDEEIEILHEKLIKAVSPILSYNASMDMFYKDKDEILNPLSTFWVNKYLDKFSLENFNPHITLKTDRAEYNNLPIKFTATRLALCQLGDLCTCRKILWETNLKSVKSIF